MEPIVINTENFENDVKKNDKIVLVDFYATWCGPCKMLAPVLEQVADEVKEKAVIGKLDIDESLDIAKEFNVMSVPTMILFKDGKEVDRIVGLRQKAQILEAINNIQ
ncbi:MAG: thioredoxin [Clostridia bacterium]|nr:thioredoxin [Clostridia bacterium]